jgi:hypothetical protein
LTELSRAMHRPATLDDMPDADLDHLAAMGFDWVWFLSVWQIGPAGQQVSHGNHEWRQEFEVTLPDVREADIAGSGFATTSYTVHQASGGDAALARLRQMYGRTVMRYDPRPRQPALADSPSSASLHSDCPPLNNNFMVGGKRCDVGAWGEPTPRMGTNQLFMDC